MFVMQAGGKKEPSVWYCGYEDGFEPGSKHYQTRLYLFNSDELKKYLKNKKEYAKSIKSDGAGAEYYLTAIYLAEKKAAKTILVEPASGYETQFKKRYRANMLVLDKYLQHDLNKKWVLPMQKADIWDASIGGKRQKIIAGASRGN